jgi:hypothetical protein
MEYTSPTILLASLLVASSTAVAAQAPSLTFDPPMRLPKLPVIGQTAFPFEAESTMGRIRFPADYAGRWVVLFSHPDDFTPVCTSELILFGASALLQPSFRTAEVDVAQEVGL